MADTKKKTASKKKTPSKPKPKPTEIPPNPSRIYGSTVYSKTTESKAEAAELVGKHGFRLISEAGGVYRLKADSMAYKSYRG